MKIANEFTVKVPIEQAWEVFTDLERIIPLMPGATLTGREGDDVSGKVKVKVGPVTSEFSGKVHFVEQDRSTYRAVIDGRGKEARGTGNAAATVTAQLHDAGGHTRVTVDTDLKIVGKLAQFGSGMLQQVSEKLLGQFVDSLEAELAADTAPPPPPTAQTQAPTTADAVTVAQPKLNGERKVSPTEAAPIDLLDLAGGGAVKKYATPLIGVVLVVAALALLRRLRR
ncbi:MULTISPECIES: SRPBCC family protein [Mycobacteriaceae]|uniref:SRPBCC family protein n=1 Tax=Mycobacteriaceae TaxID=1762 RepID=UPI00080220D3|nr:MULTISPECIES: SRPBCC family protein [Mycobacteriaceae]MCK0175569.1 SRPBCC family protein [Mycolicibacterium sp. F2034L]OBB61489.1 membrane oxidoreductase [Mycobacterium sp. 852013-51886_SCH5428379]